MYLCKGTCQKNTVTRPFGNTSPYLKGQKLCNVCGIYLVHSGLRCPCCSCKLRTGPRSGKFRRMIQEQRSMIT